MGPHPLLVLVFHQSDKHMLSAGPGFTCSRRMNCGNRWMGRIIRLWSVTRSGLESWLSYGEEGQAQCEQWVSPAVSLLHTE